MSDRLGLLDPRTKMGLAVALAVVLVLVSRLSVLAGVSAALVLLVLVLGLGRSWLGMLRVLLPMAVFLIVVMLFSFDLVTALGGALRLIAMTTAFFIFFETTAPEDLANSLVKSGVPYSFAFILTTAMQFIPVLSTKMHDVMDAQRARGIRLERDMASFRNYPALFAPFLIESFMLADQLAEAMEARGFGSAHRTFSRTYSIRPLDYVLLAVAAAVIILGVWFR